MAFLRSGSSLSTVRRSESGSLCAPGFSVAPQGHLVKTEKRGHIVLQTVTQQFFSQTCTEDDKKGAKILFLRGFLERIQERVDHI